MALVRPVTISWLERPGKDVWQIEVLSARWDGEPVAACAYRYNELDEKNQELLRGALAIQADVNCPACPNGIDLNKAERSVDLFADLLMANCAQMGDVVHQVSRQAPGSVLSYPDLRRLTLANYNAGPGCMQEALWEVKQARDPFDWSNVAQALTNLDACGVAVEYVERVTKIYP